MLDKLTDAPLESMPGLIIEATAGHYDIIAGVIAATVTDYDSAAIAEATLKEAGEQIVSWALENIRRNGPRSIREGVRRSDVQHRIRQRVAHWTVKILDLARKTESVPTHSVASSAATPPAATEIPVAKSAPDLPTEPVATPATVRRFPDRAAWVQAQLDDRRWTPKDVERYDGPNARTLRRLLAGNPVRATVLEKLIRALSLRKQVKLSDIPNS